MIDPDRENKLAALRDQRDACEKEMLRLQQILEGFNLAIDILSEGNEK